MQRELLAASLCLLAAVGACSNGGDTTQKFGSTNGSGDGPPTIVGKPHATAVVGEFYSFVANAQDPEGRPLSFSILRKPPWATFSIRTGRLSGTPRPGDMGSHVDITIAVSDGRSRAVLPAFKITVNGRGNGDATLSWHPPTQNADGTYLSDLAGYRIYFGRGANDLDSTIVVDNPGVTRYMVEGLPADRWFFAMTSIDRQGNESRRSRIVTKHIG